MFQKRIWVFNMTKPELDLLEKVFASDISGGVFQSKSKLIKKLEDDGLVIKVNKTVGRDRFGFIDVEGYRLTIAGNLQYCTSERCA